MRILSPVSPSIGTNVEELARNGADEFYLGYISGFANSDMMLSRRVGTKNSFPDLQTTAEVIKKIKSLGLKSHLAINSSFYPECYMDEILMDLDTVVDMGVDGFIMADFNLFLRFRERHPEAYVSASTCMNVMNPGTVKFFTGLGFSRVILPRHLSISEMRNMIESYPYVEFEIFIKNDECPNVDGFCRYYHGALNDRGDLFKDSDQAKTACALIKAEDKKTTGSLKMNYIKCGVCDLFHFRDLSNVSVKISGRNLKRKELLRDLKLVSSARDNLARATNENEYKNMCRESFENIYDRSCGDRCYRKIIG